MSKTVKQKVAEAMGVVDAVKPVAASRTQAGSFATMIAEMQVGDQPASRVAERDPGQSVDYTMATLKDGRDKLRNAVTSSVAQAKRRVPGAEYSIEVFDAMAPSGIYIIALVWRIA